MTIYFENETVDVVERFEHGRKWFEVKRAQMWFPISNVDRAIGAALISWNAIEC